MLHYLHIDFDEFSDCMHGDVSPDLSTNTNFTHHKYTFTHAMLLWPQTACLLNILCLIACKCHPQQLLLS